MTANPQDKKKLTVMIYAGIIFSISAFGADGAANSSAMQSACQSEGAGYCANLSQISATGLAQLGSIPGGGVGLGDFLASLYTFLVGVVALAAFLMFILGGVTYLTAGDNESRIGKAKALMKNAVTGLTIALLSWLILFTINPDLVRKLSVGGKRLELPGVVSQPTPRGWKCPGLPITFTNESTCNLVCDPMGLSILFSTAKCKSI